MIDNTTLAALARHALTTLGGGLLASWGLTGTMLDAAIGALVTLAGVAWSVYEKRSRG